MLGIANDSILPFSTPSIPSAKPPNADLQRNPPTDVARQWCVELPVED